MKCNRDDCFGYNPIQKNNCSVLEDIRGCNFFKTTEQIRREEHALRESGHKVYRPSITRNDRRLLQALLSGDEIYECTDGDVDR